LAYNVDLYGIADFSADVGVGEVEAGKQRGTQVVDVGDVIVDSLASRWSTLAR